MKAWWSRLRWRLGKGARRREDLREREDTTHDLMVMHMHAQAVASLGEFSKLPTMPYATTIPGRYVRDSALAEQFKLAVEHGRHDLDVEVRSRGFEPVTGTYTEHMTDGHADYFVRDLVLIAHEVQVVTALTWTDYADLRRQIVTIVDAEYPELPPRGASS